MNFWIILPIIIFIILVIIILNSKLYIDFELRYDSKLKKPEFNFGIRVFLLKIFSFKSEDKVLIKNEKVDKSNKKEKSNQFQSSKAIRDTKFFIKNLNGIYQSIIKINKIELKVFTSINRPDQNALVYGGVWWGTELIRLLLETYFDTGDVDISANTAFDGKNHFNLYFSGIINVKITHTIWETILYTLGGNGNERKSPNRRSHDNSNAEHKRHG